jgi:SAM-dependent methyltransferase
LFNEDTIITKWKAEMYDQNEDETNDIDFLLSVIRPVSQKILEVCCGSGRILVPLAKAGYSVTGFDTDEFMLCRITAKAEGLNNLNWYMADAVKDDWGTGFDVVVLAGNILFNIVSDIEYEKAQELFIQKAAGALRPGGFVYIDYQYFLYPEKVFENPRERIIWEGSDSDGNYGKMALLDSKYDKNTGINTSTRRVELILKNGEVIKRDTPCLKHFATMEQIHKWLSNAGFIVEQEYGDYSRNPISETTYRAIIYARKG